VITRFRSTTFDYFSMEHGEAHSGREPTVFEGHIRGIAPDDLDVCVRESLRKPRGEHLVDLDDREPLHLGQQCLRRQARAGSDFEHLVPEVES